MAFAAAFARPAASRFPLPGAASLWSAPRPFPALLWLAQRPACSAGLRAGWSPSREPARQANTPPETAALQAPAPPRTPAARDGGAASTPRQRVAGEPPRLELELRFLFSRSPLPPDEDFFVGLRIELGRRAWSLAHAVGAPRPAWSPASGDERDLEKRRARLVTDVHLGLSIVESAAVRYPRPVRNVLLARQAGQIGRCLRELLAHPAAGTLAEELTRLLDALRRRCAG